MRNFNWQEPEIIPALVQGEDAEAVYKAISGMNLGWMEYYARTKTLYGANPFIAARIDSHLRQYGIRVADLRDLLRPELELFGDMRLPDKIDMPALILRTMDDPKYPKNLPLIKRIAEEVEKANGKLELPVMITGFDVKPLERNWEGYGIDIVIRDDFKAVHDGRLDGFYDSRSFSCVDDLGLPVFEPDGCRSWHARENGLSRLCKFGPYISSEDGDLIDSDYKGGVLIVKPYKEIKEK